MILLSESSTEKETSKGNIFMLDTLTNTHRQTHKQIDTQID